MTQAQQIDDFVENTCWSDELNPDQIKTPHDRKINLRAAILAGHADTLSQLAEAKRK